MRLPPRFNQDIHETSLLGFAYPIEFLKMCLYDRYALLFSFPGNEGVTLQLQSPHLSYVAPGPVEFCK